MPLTEREKKVLSEVDVQEASKRVGLAGLDPSTSCLYVAAALLLSGLALRRSCSRFQASLHRDIGFLVSACVSATVTCYCVLSFLLETPPGGNRFLLVYQQVSEDPFGWFWSSMLLSWAVTASSVAPCMAPDASTFDLLVFLGLGQMTAPSSAFPLFFKFAGPPSVDGVSMSIQAAMLLLAGHTAIFSCRLASDAAFHGDDFYVALGMLHAIMLMPTLIFRSGRVPLRVFLCAAAALSAVQHFIAIGMAVMAADTARGFPSLLLHGLHRNRCQLAIGVSSIFVHFQGQLYLGHNAWSVLDDTFLALFLSPGAVFAWRLFRIAPQEQPSKSKDSTTKKSQ